MRPFGLVLAGLLGVGILTYLCGNHHGPHFAADLSAKTNSALMAAGIAPAAQAAGEGQIITLTGQVATEAIKMRAGEEASRIGGVEEVRNLLTVAPPGPPPPPMSAVQRVEAVNCQKIFTTLLNAEKIRFQTGKADINPASHRLLGRLVETAGKCPAARIRVEGHTDSSGARDMNQKLSQQRAEAVVEYLKSKGMAAERLTSASLGPGQPLADNKTPAGREKNRRTEFKVQGI